MATGYTHAVQDGTITEFTDFAMQCARAFGACITMRDDPMDAQIPDEFQPDGYAADRLKELQAELSTLTAMSDGEKAAAAKADYDAEVANHDSYETKKVQEKKRYEAMLRKVEAWTPPTSDHAELKKFMCDQLSSSINFDCSPISRKRPQPKTVEAWYAAKLEDLHRDIAYQSEEAAKDIERAHKRTEWVRALRASLKKESADA